jgi:thiosulfate/3-mercaptopyruvate sulfurtransferase
MPETAAPTSVADITSRGYAHPEVLVSTQWVADHLKDPKVRLLESNEDILLYETGHIPGAVKIDWVADLNDPLTRDYIDRSRFQRLLRAKGISNDTTIVFYGDKNNWWATYAFWVFSLFGLKNLRVMDGGRLRWAQEQRELVTALPSYPEGDITVSERNDVQNRAFREQVLAHVVSGRRLVDVRSPEEYRGERLHMPEYPNEGALRGGHIPGARSIPWGRAVNPETHTFRPASELRTIYQEENGLAPGDDVVVYCRIGERSSHTWFALTYLLGFTNVRNYDGSWTEWGNLVKAPVEKP